MSTTGKCGKSKQYDKRNGTSPCLLIRGRGLNTPKS